MITDEQKKMLDDALEDLTKKEADSSAQHIRYSLSEFARMAKIPIEVKIQVDFTYKWEGKEI